MKRIILACFLMAISVESFAERHSVSGATITDLAINGGQDSPVVGTSCLRISGAVSASCTNGWIAVVNNNKALISAALAAKMANNQILFYYHDGEPAQLCPGITNTTCSVATVVIK